MKAENKVEAINLVKRLIELIGDDPNRDGLLDTPKRVVNSWSELYSGYKDDVEKYAKVFESNYDQIITITGIDYFSMCEHHMLPFYGQCSVAYLPNGSNQVLGVSKFCRIIETFSRRLQIQEQLTQQIANAINDMVEPKGVAVIVKGAHLCMMARGVKQQRAEMKTSCMLGLFRDSQSARAEVLHLIGN